MVDVMGHQIKTPQRFGIEPAGGVLACAVRSICGPTESLQEPHAAWPDWQPSPLGTESRLETTGRPDYTHGPLKEQP